MPGLYGDGIICERGSWQLFESLADIVRKNIEGA
jgi:hypothetical protein